MAENDDGLDHAVIADLKELCEDTGEDVIAQLLEVFFAELPDRLAAVHALARAGELTAVSRDAHRMKGSAVSIGAQRMAQICGALEMAAERGGTSLEIGNLLAALDAEADRVGKILPLALGRAAAQ